MEVIYREYEMRYASMELTLSSRDEPTSQIPVSCDGQPSHTFVLLALIHNERHGLPVFLTDPVTDVSAFYASLFSLGGHVQKARIACCKALFTAILPPETVAR